MLVADCRLYCIDNKEDKVIFRIKTVKWSGMSRHYSMFKFTPNTSDFKLFIQNPGYRAFENGLYYMDKEIKVINYLGKIGDSYFEVISNDLGSVLPYFRNEDVKDLYIEFLKANITPIPDKKLEDILSRFQRHDLITLEVDSINQYLDSLGNSKVISKLEDDHYLRFGSIDYGYHVASIGSIINNIDRNGGLYNEENN